MKKFLLYFFPACILLFACTININAAAAEEIVYEETVVHEHDPEGSGVCYEPIYHTHSGSSSSGGGCYVPRMVAGDHVGCYLSGYVNASGSMNYHCGLCNAYISNVHFGSWEDRNKPGWTYLSPQQFCAQATHYSCPLAPQKQSGWMLGCGMNTSSVERYNLVCDRGDLFKITLIKTIDEDGYKISTKIEILDEDTEITDAVWSDGSSYDLIINDNGDYVLTISYADDGREKTESITYTVEDFFLDIEGTVAWSDGSNKFGTRPDQVSIVLLRDGKETDRITGLTSDNMNPWIYESLYRYSPQDGHMYDYETVLEGVESKFSPEDKYVTSQSGNNYLNTLQNVQDDLADDVTFGKGYFVAGDIIWDDNNDSLGYRPKRATAHLYREGASGRELYKSVDVDAFREGSYEFVRLPKYYFDSSGEPFKYTYSVDESISARYINDKWEVKDVYRILPDTPNRYSFTNQSVISGNILGIKPDKEDNGGITVKTDTDEKITINFKQMECIANPDGTLTFGDGYSGIEYNIIVDKDGVKIDLPDGKYEITLPDSRYLPTDIISDAENIEVTEENGKWYLYVDNSNSPDSPDEEQKDIKIDSDDRIIMNLKQMEYTVNPDGSLSFGSSYSGTEFNIAIDKDGIVLDIPDGKYEVNIADGRFSPANLEVLNGDKVTVKEENGKWYIYVNSGSGKDNDNGGISIIVDKKEFFQDRDARNNFFRVTMVYI